eukprot:gb/GECG01010219.1/.p1 GENE.gb/GECG01010219.1/~~gb/GECG01010219.1/.p1  ORF type:complete len:711 (+),score=65.66 gb/GECG01010219.1/:1-2133(+)
MRTPAGPRDTDFSSSLREDELNVTLREFVLLMWVTLASWFIAYLLTVRYRDRPTFFNKLQTLAEPLAAHLIALTGAMVIINTILVPFASVVITQVTVDSNWVKAHRILGFLFQLAVDGSSVALFIFLPLAYIDHKRPGFAGLTGMKRHVMSFLFLGGCLLLFTAIIALVQWIYESKVYVQSLVAPGATNAMLIPGLLAYLVLVPAGSLEIAYKVAFRIGPCTENGRQVLENEVANRDAVVKKLGEHLKSLNASQNANESVDLTPEGHHANPTEYRESVGSVGSGETRSIDSGITSRGTVAKRSSSQRRRSSTTFGQLARKLALEIEFNNTTPGFSPASQRVIDFARKEYSSPITRQRSSSDSNRSSLASFWSEQLQRVLGGHNATPDPDSKRTTNVRRRRLSEPKQTRRALGAPPLPLSASKRLQTVLQRVTPQGKFMKGKWLLLDHLYAKECDFVDLLKSRLRGTQLGMNLLYGVLFGAVIFLNLCITFRASCMPFLGAIYAATGHELDWMEVFASVAGIEKHRAAILTSFFDVGMTLYFATCCIMGFYPEILSSDGRQRYFASKVREACKTSNISVCPMIEDLPREESSLSFGLLDFAVGKYISFRERNHPLPQRTAMNVLLGHALLLLVLSFAMPVALGWLGVGAMNVMKVADSYYGNVSIARSGALAHVYSFAFAILMGWLHFLHASALIPQCCGRDDVTDSKKQR